MCHGERSVARHLHASSPLHRHGLRPCDEDADAELRSMTA
ncbi:hypothetical protein [Polaromonas sp. CG9_12]|nr:hypothetical protein [Polaromonas sp. CG9_12]